MSGYGAQLRKCERRGEGKRGEMMMIQQHANVNAT
jgi:hypothetical protein